ncbi:hypothetical protein MLD38_034959 [Melastoma candidum]|uniref:Uncharacterized protein n=1 Tax=Melastoma candidum TaxID=119954 RepID=A0ACB9MDX3_9MYRT|nr:hypothetical protein MLD38_034959 [Melastoma candidum]
MRKGAVSACERGGGGRSDLKIQRRDKDRVFMGEGTMGPNVWKQQRGGELTQTSDFRQTQTQIVLLMGGGGGGWWAGGEVEEEEEEKDGAASLCVIHHHHHRILLSKLWGVGVGAER